MLNLVIGLHILLWFVAFGAFASDTNIALIQIGGGLMLSLIFGSIIFELMKTSQVVSHLTVIVRKTLAHSLGFLFGVPLVLLIVHLSFRLTS
jgi:hypothetical protein